MRCRAFAKCPGYTPFAFTAEGDQRCSGDCPGRRCSNGVDTLNGRWRREDRDTPRARDGLDSLNGRIKGFLHVRATTGPVSPSPKLHPASRARVLARNLPDLTSSFALRATPKCQHREHSLCDQGSWSRRPNQRARNFPQTLLRVAASTDRRWGSGCAEFLADYEENPKFRHLATR
jgi:hypothetical protein